MLRKHFIKIILSLTILFIFSSCSKSYEISLDKVQQIEVGDKYIYTTNNNSFGSLCFSYTGDFQGEIVIGLYEKELDADQLFKERMNVDSQQPNFIRIKSPLVKPEMQYLDFYLDKAFVYVLKKSVIADGRLKMKFDFY